MYDAFDMREVDPQGAKLTAWAELEQDTRSDYVSWSMEQLAEESLARR